MLMMGEVRTYVTDTPAAFIGPLWRLVDLILFAEKGTFPVAGGVLDQTAAFLRLMQAWRNAIARYPSNG